MAKFVTLTCIDGESIIVNIENIVTINSVTLTDGQSPFKATKIDFDTSVIHVKESITVMPQGDSLIIKRV